LISRFIFFLTAKIWFVKIEILLNVEKLTENIGFGIPIGQNVSFGGFHNFWYQNFGCHNRFLNQKKYY
jgi:hypothetical protein